MKFLFAKEVYAKGEDGAITTYYEPLVSSLDEKGTPVINMTPSSTSINNWGMVSSENLLELQKLKRLPMYIGAYICNVSDDVYNQLEMKLAEEFVQLQKNLADISKAVQKMNSAKQEINDILKGIKTQMPVNVNEEELNISQEILVSALHDNSIGTLLDEDMNIIEPDKSSKYVYDISLLEDEDEDDNEYNEDYNEDDSYDEDEDEDEDYDENDEDNYDNGKSLDEKNIDRLMNECLKDIVDNF